MDNKDIHPLTQIIRIYCSQYDSLRENNLDLSPMAFHKHHGLAVHVPYSWDVLLSVKHIISEFNGKVVVIFGSTESYCKIFDILPDGVEYKSWHEINTGIHAASMDIRYIQSSKKLLGEADLVFFLDPPSSMPEVVNQVYGQTMNCLIVLSGGGV